MKEKFDFDLHCHLYLYNNYKNIINNIEERKMYCLIVTNKPSQYKYSKYSSKYVKYALGYHPLEITNEYKKEVGIFLNELSTTKYIGEIGLDYTGENVELQRDVFQLILKLSNNKGKILSIHCRKAENDLIKYINGFNGKIIIHWYSGNYTNLKELVNKGCYFSINTNMMKSKKAEKYFEIMPIDKILLESDAPYTNGFRQKYDISNFEQICEYLSLKYNYIIEDIYKILKTNFKILLENKMES